MPLVCLTRAGTCADPFLVNLGDDETITHPVTDTCSNPDSVNCLGDETDFFDYDDDVAGDICFALNGVGDYVISIPSSVVARSITVTTQPTATSGDEFE